MSNKQASEEQALKDVFMSLNENIVEFCMNDMLLTIEQNEKQFSIFSNIISTIILTDHTMITIINKASEKNTATYIAEL